MHTRKLVSLTMILLLAIILAACGGGEKAAPTMAPKEEKAAPTMAPKEEEATPTMAPKEEKADKKLTIAGVVFQSDTFMQTVQAGMKAAADEMDVNLILGNSESDLAKEASMIDDYITRGVDAILITPISRDGSVAALKAAKKAGITIVCFNTCVSEPGIASAFLVTKNEDLGATTGAAAMEFIKNELGGKAKIGLLNCDQFEGCPPRKAGFLEKVKSLPGVEVVADQAGWVADDATPISEAMLQAHPEINLLWAANEGGTVAHALAVKSSGLAGEVFVFGTDMNKQMAQMLQADDNIMQAVTGQAPYEMGYDSLMTTLKVLAGEEVPDTQNTPTILFARGNDELINHFVETEGNAIFDTGSADMSGKDSDMSDTESMMPSGEGKLIAGVVFQSDTFMQTVQAGIKAAAEEMGGELILGNSESDLAKEASMIDDYITRGVDAILITPISRDGSVAALKAAKKAGITIVCFNTCVSEPGIASAFLVTKNEDLGATTGAAAMEFIKNELDGKAKIGLLNCDQFEGCPPRKAGFLEKVKSLPGVEVVADQAGWVADDATPISEAMLQAHPEINLLWAANEGGTVAHALAVKSSGLAGEVFVFGTDMNKQMAQMLQADDNIMQAVTGQAPFEMGYDAYATTLKVLAGEDVPDVQNTPTILFARGDDEMINHFVETEGNAIFK